MSATELVAPLAPGAIGGTGEPVIRLEGARKTYRTGELSFEALRGIDLTINEGEYVAIIGPSGSGKSTLMNILGCLDVLTEGSYLLAGEDVAALTEEQLAAIRNRRIGFVFQQFHLLPSLSALANVELPLVYGGVRQAERRRRAKEALALVGLESKAANRPGELSGGQQQRVAIARALVTEPTMLLADEPTGNLDSTSTEEILGVLDSVHAQGRTIVLITHEAAVAERAQTTHTVADGRFVVKANGARA